MMCVNLLSCSLFFFYRDLYFVDAVLVMCVLVASVCVDYSTYIINYFNRIQFGLNKMNSQKYSPSQAIYLMMALHV
jgi:hypothetical protein